MKKNIYTFLTAAALLGTAAIIADSGVIVHVKDGTTKFYPSYSVESVEFTQDYEEPDPTPGPGDDTDLTDAIKNLTVGSTLNAVAVVTAQSSRGLILTDNAGSILYYNPAVDLSNYPIGTVVNVMGNPVVYNRGFELDSSAVLTNVGEMEYEYPAPTVYDATMVNTAVGGSDEFLAEYVCLKGKLSISGNYYNIVLDGTSNQGSVYFPTDELKSMVEDGESYAFYGYFIAVSGGKYFNIVVTHVGDINGSVPEIPGEDEDPEDPGEEDPGEENSLTDVIKNLTVGSTLNAVAVVTAQSSRGLILTDNAGSILYYNPSVDLSNYPIGTVVKVSGKTLTYNRGFELDNTAILTKVDEMEYEYPAPAVYDSSKINAAVAGSDNFLAEYVCLKGKLSISGNYYNIVVDGTSNQGSVYYPTDEIKSQMKDGESYAFYGYYMAVSGGKYFNVLVTHVGDVNGSDPENPGENEDPENPGQDEPGDEVEIPSEYQYPLSYVRISSDVPQQVKEYTGFTVNFNKNNHTPNYVAWELTAEEANGSVPTSRSYWQDADIVGCAPVNDGWATAGYDRGHMCPAADQKWSSSAMKDCAVMANMVPQPNSFNGGKWASLENSERKNAEKYGKIWIISGPLYDENDTKLIGDAKTRVPGACFKAFLYENGANSKAIAFVMNNDATNTGNIQNYAMSIDDLESITGYDFFPALPDEIEKVVEATFDYSQWN